jgi:type II secretory pathway pseudopilin PulG
MLSRASVRRFLGRLKHEAGITVIEMVVAVAILGLVAPAAMTFVFSMQRNERRVSEATAQEHEARLAVESLSRSLREAGYPEGLSYDSSSIFLTAANDAVTFYSDPDSDSVMERITYRLVPSTSLIERVTVEPDCSVSPCSYATGATSSTRTAVSNVRNGDMSACGSAPGTIEKLFRFYTVDRGSGVRTEISSFVADRLVDVSYVQATVVTDITPGQSPICHRLTTGVTLRNWRG